VARARTEPVVSVDESTEPCRSSGEAPKPWKWICPDGPGDGPGGPGPDITDDDRAVGGADVRSAEVPSVQGPFLAVVHERHGEAAAVPSMRP
jgi:hypothetical protein